MTGKEPAPAPTLEQVRRLFERTREKIRQIEDRARRELPHKPPGNGDPGSSAPTSPKRH